MPTEFTSSFLDSRAWEMPRAPAAVRWLTPRSCRSRERVRENSAFKFLTSRGGPQAAVSGSHLDLQYIQYSIMEALRHVKRKMKIFAEI